MAERRIQDFAVAADAQDEDLLLVSSNGETYTVTVKTLKDSLQRGDGISDNAKNLILSLFEGAAYGNSSMQSVLNSLKAEWNGSSGGSSGGGSTTVAVQSVSLSRSTLSLTAGNSSTLTATVSPSNATNKTVTWSISPSGYASLSSTSGSSVTVTASKAGSCTVIATAGGKSANCSVSVSASSGGSGGSTGGTDISGETPVYKLAAAKTFTAANKDYIDTGVKLFATVDPKPSWTILMEVQGNNLAAATDTYVLAHCMEETKPWPGLSIAVWGNSGLGMNLYTSSCLTSSLSVLNSRSIKIGIVISGSTLTTRTNSGATEYTSLTYAPSTAVDKSLLIGAYQQSDGTKGRFFNGTVHQFMVFNKALDVSTVEGWING